MKLSKETLDILKNFANINQNIVIKEGKVLSTMSTSKDVLAEFEGEDDFDEKMSIFNLSEFLGVVLAFEDPELILDKKFCVIKQGKHQVKYVYADESVLISPKKSITMPNAEVNLHLTQDQISRLQKMSSVLSVEDLAIVGNGENVSVKVFDAKNPTANNYEIELDEKTTETFQIDFKVEKLRLYPSDYDVEISSKKISCWKATGLKLKVFIAVEATSTFS